MRMHADTGLWTFVFCPLPASLAHSPCWQAGSRSAFKMTVLQAASGSRASMACSLLCLPALLLQRILSSATCHENLLLFVSTCARVCHDFRQAVRESAGYGAGLLHHPRASVPAGYYHDGLRTFADERSRVLREISDAIFYSLEGREEDLAVDEEGICPGELELSNSLLGEAGCRALGAALQSMPAPLALTDMYLDGCEMTAAGMSAVAASMRRGFAGEGLIRLHLYNNPSIGDCGMIILSRSLPSTLVHFGLSNVGCGSAGMLAVVSALPRLTHLRELNVSHNPEVQQSSWKAFAEVLPELSCIRHLNVNHNPGMGVGGVLSFCAALKKCEPPCPGTLRIEACQNSNTIACRDALLHAWGTRHRAKLHLDDPF